MIEFNCNYNELAWILNNYETIVNNYKLLDSTHPEISKAAAEVIYPILLQFEMRVPEETRKNISRQTDILKKKCLAFISAS
ncbi:MAG: hypothetical protein AABW47_00065 [Nanoarchaeota archaeon]